MVADKHTFTHIAHLVVWLSTLVRIQGFFVFFFSSFVCRMEMELNGIKKNELPSIAIANGRPENATSSSCSPLFCLVGITG